MTGAEGLFVELHQSIGGELRNDSVAVPVWVRVDDIVLMNALAEMGRANVPTGKFIGSSIRLRHGGLFEVDELPGVIFQKVIEGMAR